jgi:predicted nucleic acid-binding protein
MAAADTNVYYSAFTARGVASEVWCAALDRRYALLMSPAIVEELAGVLRR